MYSCQSRRIIFVHRDNGRAIVVPRLCKRIDCAGCLPWHLWIIRERVQGSDRFSPISSSYMGLNRSLWWGRQTGSNDALRFRGARKRAGYLAINNKPRYLLSTHELGDQREVKDLEQALDLVANVLLGSRKSWGGIWRYSVSTNWEFLHEGGWAASQRILEEVEQQGYGRIVNDALIPFATDPVNIMVAFQLAASREQRGEL